MRVIQEGYSYEAANMEEGPRPPQRIDFIKKEQIRGELTTVMNGTTNEEVLSILINRMEYLQGKFSCEENVKAIAGLRSALGWLNKRTAGRKARGVEGRNIK